MPGPTDPEADYRTLIARVLDYRDWYRMQVVRLLTLREQIGDTVRSALPRARLALEIADDLIAHPILSVSDAQRRYGRSNQANRNAIGSLIDLGVLEPYRNARYDRLYWNRRVFQIIDS